MTSLQNGTVILNSNLIFTSGNLNVSNVVNQILENSTSSTYKVLGQIIPGSISATGK